MKLSWTFLHSMELQRRNCRAQGTQEVLLFPVLVILMKQLLQSIPIFTCMSVTNKDVI